MGVINMSEKNLKEITYSGEFVNELESKIEYLKKSIKCWKEYFLKGEQ